MLNLLLVRTLSPKAANAELDVPPKFLDNQVSSESQNQILNSKPGSVIVLISFSNSNSTLIEIPPSHDSEKSHTTSEGVSNNNCFEESVEIRIYPTLKRLDKLLKSQTNNKERKLSLGETQTNSSKLGTTKLSGDFSNCDIEVEMSPNIAEDYPNQKIRSLRS